MTNTQKALLISLVSAVVIAIPYWLAQTLISSISPWMVALIVFIVAFIGMKYKDWMK